ncbi:MAG: phosphoribosylglycinamide formyltransferase [Pirellulaceae bacterium]|nr:phosphoribosylglycinamide formyltransferase [Pirellulaceae bacterium]
MGGKTKLPVVVMISGGGTTLRNLLEVIKRGELDLDIKLVISSRASAKGLDYAKKANIPTLIVSRRESTDTETFSGVIFDACRNVGAELVVMGGFLQHILIPSDFKNKVINIHPSLLPAFSGKGYYGLRVHQAVLDFGVKVTGCTIHFVDNEYDHGPIIAQYPVEVLKSDDVTSLAARVFEVECRAYPDILQRYYLGKIAVSDRKVTLLDS